MRILALLFASALFGQVTPVPYMLRPDKVKKAQAFYDKGQYTEALEVSQSALDGTLTKDKQARAYWLLGKSYEALGASDKALSNYQVAVTIYPRDPGLLTALGDLYYRVGLFGQAKTQYVAAVKADPRKTAAHIGLGRVQMGDGLYELAEAQFQAAVDNKIEPADFLEATLGLGRAQAGDGRLDDAEQTLRAGLKAGGGADIRIALAEVLKRRKLLPDAIEMMLEASRQSDRPDIRLRCAAWLLEAGKVAEASDILTARLKQEPEDALASYLLGLIELRQGRPADAAKRFRTAAEQDDSPFLREIARRTLKTQGSR